MTTVQQLRFKGPAVAVSQVIVQREESRLSACFSIIQEIRGGAAAGGGVCRDTRGGGAHAGTLRLGLASHKWRWSKQNAPAVVEGIYDRFKCSQVVSQILPFATVSSSAILLLLRTKQLVLLCICFVFV